MVQALEARDPAALRQVLMHHLDNKRNVVIDQLRAVRHSIDSTPDTLFLTEGHTP
jgi:DNA-binding GntR family transcriptional regulator